MLLVCLVLLSISNLAFGFCMNIWLSCAVRFMNGLVNGVIVVSKTILYEVSDNTNQAAIMSVIGLAWGSGIILGPLISGELRLFYDAFVILSCLVSVAD